ncbi:hypothetical protein [Kitasatospora sp. NPDC087314]|uniref:hypothetical protein n=1 Tax=Kitasatospora sp. NPDC087314 TaxID=3364068 RepID=UPI0037F4D106
MGDGTANVGLGVLDTAGVDLDRRDLLRRWCDRLPPEYGYTPEAVTEPIRGSVLPMGLNCEPHYADGLLLVGDAGGTVSPGVGEGIAYAMESGRFAAETAVQALARRTDRGRELALRSACAPPALRLRWLLRARPARRRPARPPPAARRGRRRRARQPGPAEGRLPAHGQPHRAHSKDALNRLLHLVEWIAPGR